MRFQPCISAETHTTLLVDWSKQLDTQLLGNEIDAFRLQWRVTRCASGVVPRGGVHWISTSPTDRIRVVRCRKSGLLAETTYQFRVASIDKRGREHWGPPSAPVATLAVPRAFSASRSAASSDGYYSDSDDHTSAHRAESGAGKPVVLADDNVPVAMLSWEAGKQLAQSDGSITTAAAPPAARAARAARSVKPTLRASQASPSELPALLRLQTPPDARPAAPSSDRYGNPGGGTRGVFRLAKRPAPLDTDSSDEDGDSAMIAVHRCMGTGDSTYGGSAPANAYVPPQPSVKPEPPLSEAGSYSYYSSVAGQESAGQEYAQAYAAALVAAERSAAPGAAPATPGLLGRLRSAVLPSRSPRATPVAASPTSSTRDPGPPAVTLWGTPGGVTPRAAPARGPDSELASDVQVTNRRVQEVKAALAALAIASPRASLVGEPAGSPLAAASRVSYTNRSVVTEATEATLSMPTFSWSGGMREAVEAMEATAGALPSPSGDIAIRAAGRLRADQRPGTAHLVEADARKRILQRLAVLSMPSPARPTTAPCPEGDVASDTTDPYVDDESCVALTVANDDAASAFAATIASDDGAAGDAASAFTALPLQGPAPRGACRRERDELSRPHPIDGDDGFVYRLSAARVVPNRARSSRLD